MTTAIRPAQEADLDGIARVGEITWPAAYLTFAGADYVRHNLETYWSSSALQHALSDSLVFLVAVDDDEVTGVLEVGQFGSSPTMWRLYVMPARQGSGIGTALLHAAIDALPEGSTELVTEYTAGNDATGRWYEVRGFTETHRDPRPQGLDVVWMRLAFLCPSGPSPALRRASVGCRRSAAPPVTPPITTSWRQARRKCRSSSSASGRT